MPRRTALLLVVLFSAWMLGLHASMKKQPDPEEVRELSELTTGSAKWVGRIAPELALATLDGKRFDLADHVGREVILLNFFATWCEPCRAEMPELVRFAESNSAAPFVLLEIDAAENQASVEKFVQEFHVRSPVGIDADRALQRRFGVRAFPTSVLIGADGRILLYENTVIRNADIALKPLVEGQLALIRGGSGTTRDAWLAASRQENYRDVAPPARSGGIVLTGRAKSLAERMGCLCGCTNKLETCTCQTATGMKKKLQEGNFGEKSDDEIARELGKEFCMKGM